MSRVSCGSVSFWPCALVRHIQCSRPSRHSARDSHPCRRVSASSSCRHALCPPDCFTLADPRGGGAAPVPFDHKLSCFERSSPPVHRSFKFFFGSLSTSFNDPFVGLRLAWWSFNGICRFCETPSTCRFREGGPATGPVPQISICSWILLSRVPSFGLTCFIAHFLLHRLSQRRVVRLSEQPHGVHCSHSFMIRARSQSRHG